MKGETYV